MKAKEKAQELVDRFYKIPNSQGIYMMQHYQAKQCAIIAVDEILEVYRKNWGIENSEWLDVKNEIEKL